MLVITLVIGYTVVPHYTGLHLNITLIFLRDLNDSAQQSINIVVSQVLYTVMTSQFFIFLNVFKTGG